MISHEDLSEDVLGVIWIEETPLSAAPKGLSILDYFLDGLLTNYINKLEGKKEEDKNFFSTSHFGRPFYVAKINPKASTFKNDISELLPLFQVINSEVNTILVSGANTNQESFLKTKQSTYKFKFI